MKVFHFALALLAASMIGFSDAGMEFGCDCSDACAEASDPDACCDECFDDGGRALVVEQQQDEPVFHRELDLFLRHGKCCNKSGVDQWALVDIPPCQWIKLAHGACTGGWTSHDCEGMTCGGGFYKVSGSSTGSCVTPGKDSPPYNKRRWTPDKQDCNAKAPSDICPKVSDTPPGFEYGPRPECGDRLLRTTEVSVENPLCGGCEAKPVKVEIP